MLILLAMGLSSTVKAAVTDIFDCKLAIIIGDGSEALSQANRVAVIRKPEGKRDGFVFTRGEARLSLLTKNNGVIRKADVHLVIRHAYQEIQNNPAMAFQSTCFSPETYFCDSPNCKEIWPESGTCNPGSPEQVGSRVAMIDHIPAIELSHFREAVMSFGSGPRDGEAKVDCKHVGTYR
jgi:hypothetical protein